MQIYYANISICICRIRCGSRCHMVQTYILHMIRDGGWKQIIFRCLSLAYMYIYIYTYDNEKIVSRMMTRCARGPKGVPWCGPEAAWETYSCQRQINTHSMHICICYMQTRLGIIKLLGHYHNTHVFIYAHTIHIYFL